MAKKNTARGWGAVLSKANNPKKGNAFVLSAKLVKKAIGEAKRIDSKYNKKTGVPRKKKGVSRY